MSDYVEHVSLRDERDLRQSVLQLIDPCNQSLPSCPSVAFVWPTELCSIGCAHCNFGSREYGGPENRALAGYPEILTDWLAKAGAKRLVVCGGGEPLDEPDFIVRSISACASKGLAFEIYTSGVSSRGPIDISNSIRRWRDAWQSRIRNNHRLRIRLSVDCFHDERLGLEPVAQWIDEIERSAPEWIVSLRGIRVKGDTSLTRLAMLMNARYLANNENSGWLTTAGGRRILVELKGFIFEGRASRRALQRRGLALVRRDREVINQLATQYGNETPLGRPLSARLTVMRHHMDLEIHSDCVVHLLESQASDLRVSFLTHSWEEMRALYYRDPIVHLVAWGGLPAFGKLIMQANKKGISRTRTVPFSIEKLTDRSTLNWVTAQAMLLAPPGFNYSEPALKLARDYLKCVEGAAEPV